MSATDTAEHKCILGFCLSALGAKVLVDFEPFGQTLRVKWVETHGHNIRVRLMAKEAVPLYVYVVLEGPTFLPNEPILLIPAQYFLPQQTKRKDNLNIN